MQMNLANTSKLKSSTKYVLKHLGFSYCAVFGILLFYNISIKIFPDHLQNSSEIKASFNSKITGRNLSFLFLSTVIIAPTMEELIFRIGITKRKLNFYILLLATLIYLTLAFLKSKYIFSLAIAIYPVSQYLLYRFFGNDKNYFSISIIFSAIYFGLIHIFNFNHDLMKNLFSYAVMILPLMVFGYTFGKIRLKLGIGYAILAHMILNFIGFMSGNFFKLLFCSLIIF